MAGLSLVIIKKNIFHNYGQLVIGNYLDLLLCVQFAVFLSVITQTHRHRMMDNCVHIHVYRPSTKTMTGNYI